MNAAAALFVSRDQVKMHSNLRELKLMILLSKEIHVFSILSAKRNSNIFIRVAERRGNDKEHPKSTRREGDLLSVGATAVDSAVRSRRAVGRSSRRFRLDAAFSFAKRLY